MEREAIQNLLRHYALLVQWSYALPGMTWVPYTRERKWKRLLGVILFPRISGWFIIGHVKRHLQNLLRHLNASIMLMESTEEKGWVDSEIKAIESFHKSLPSVIIPKWILYIIIALITYTVLSLPSFSPAERTAAFDLATGLIKVDFKDMLAAIQKPELKGAMLRFCFILFFYSIPLLAFIMGLFNIKRYAFNNPDTPLSGFTFQTMKEEWTRRNGVYEIERKAFRQAPELQVDLFAQILIGVPFIAGGSIFIYYWLQYRTYFLLFLSITWILIGGISYVGLGIANWYKRYHNRAPGGHQET